jgi:NDP-sugar pyrophosphorylase family protein
MLVAAGFGTRLEPLTRELPKPAVPVGNRPAAWFAFDHLRRAGVRDFVVNTHHLAAELRAALEPLVPSDAALRFVHEEQILGTGGGVRNAWQPQRDEDFVVMNAKLLFAPDLQRALRVHRESGAIATMVLRSMPPSTSGGPSFAPVEVDGAGRIRKLRGLPKAADSGTLAPRMYTGLQILSARAHRELPQDGDIIEHAYLHWIARGETVMGVLDDSPWMDVGVTPRHYLEANLALATGAIEWPGIHPGEGATLIAPDAHLDPAATVERSVLGPRAIIQAGTTLRDCVVWPGATAPPGDHDRTIFTTGGRMVSVARK